MVILKGGTGVLLSGFLLGREWCRQCLPLPVLSLHYIEMCILLVYYYDVDAFLSAMHYILLSCVSLTAMCLLQVYLVKLNFEVIVLCFSQVIVYLFVSLMPSKL